jgi:glyoxylase-like metal-dependent hydrolase (beta-lactamase superfamily II)
LNWKNKMRLFFHYCSFGFSNCYILGDDPKTPPPAETAHSAEAAPPAETAPPAEAIIIDPGTMDEHILKTIENNELQLRAVLITHDHLGHVRGLRTLRRIYDVEIFAVNRVILDHKTSLVKDGDKINIGPFNVEVISIPGHSADSVVYRIGDLLFTGDALTAGLVGLTASAYGAATQIDKLRSRLFSLPGDYSVLPGHGPPSSLEAERRFNMGFSRSNQRRNRKFRLGL